MPTLNLAGHGKSSQLQHDGDGDGGCDDADVRGDHVA